MDCAHWTLSTMCAELEREAANLSREETKLLQQLKLTAKRDPDAAKPLARQLVKLRQRQTQLRSQAAHINGISTALRSQAAMHTTATAMGSSAAAMGKLGTAMDPVKMAQGMQAQFQLLRILTTSELPVQVYESNDRSHALDICLSLRFAHKDTCKRAAGVLEAERKDGHDIRDDGRHDRWHVRGRRGRRR